MMIKAQTTLQALHQKEKLSIFSRECEINSITWNCFHLCHVPILKMLEGKTGSPDYVFVLSQLPETACGAVTALHLFTDCHNF